MSTLHVEHRGNGPALVLLHPVGLDGSSWSRFSMDLEMDYAVYRVDLPGHGQSPMAGTTGTLASYADAVSAAIGPHVSGPFVVMGLSFGGMIAQTIAIRRPAGLAGLILCGCGCTFPDAARANVRQRGEKALSAGMAGVVEETVSRWFTPAFLGSPAVAQVRAELVNEDPVSWAVAWEAISRLDTEHDLARVEVPTLCVAGELDQGSPPEAVKRMASAIPGSAYAELPEAPHMMQIETPDALRAAVRPFLDGVRAGESFHGWSERAIG